MAIAQDPLKISQSIEVSQSDFNTISEDTIKNAAATAKNSAFNGTNQVLNNKLEVPKVNQLDTSNSNSSIFTDVLCCKLPSVLQRMDGYLGSLGNWRDINFDSEYMLDVCGNKKKLRPMDVVLGASNFIMNNPGIFTASNEERLSAILKSDFMRKLDLLGLGNSIPMCILWATKSNVYRSSGYSGPSLRSRNKLRELMQQNSCTALISNQPLVSSWLSNSMAANMISVLLAGDEATAYDYINVALGISGQRESALGGLALSFGNAYDYNTKKKFEVLNTYTSSGKLNSRDYIYLQYDSNKILESLDAENKENPSTNPSKDLDNITNGLDVLDPNWNKDTEGNLNYGNAGNNTTLGELSTSKLQSITIKSLNLTGKYTTTLTPAHHIAIIKTMRETEVA